MRRVGAGLHELLVEAHFRIGDCFGHGQPDPPEARGADGDEKRLYGLNSPREVPNTWFDQLLTRQRRIGHPESIAIRRLDALFASA